MEHNVEEILRQAGLAKAISDRVVTMMSEDWQQKIVDADGGSEALAVVREFLADNKVSVE